MTTGYKNFESHVQLRCAMRIRVIGAVVLMLGFIGAMSAAGAQVVPAASTNAAVSQAPRDVKASRPKIGLVLSGGGARGIAHVGVLKELHAARIPIDFVAGTSMGSIIGGLYASGMKPDELEKRILAMDWDAVLAGRPPREELSLRRKADDLKLSLPFEIGMRDRELRAPRAAVGSMGLESVLKQLTDGVPNSVAFDKLPIPYRTVATDLVTGEAVVFDRGELSAVMRASMSVPAAFAPAEIDGRLLVDGGLVNNLPVDLVRAMGADVVIAVNIGTPLLPREQLGSIFGISMQMLNILTEQNVRTSLASLKSSDVLVVPDLAEVTSADFKLGAIAMQRGAEALRGVLPLLTNHALSIEEYAKHIGLERESVKVGKLDEIRIEGTTYAGVDTIRAQLSVLSGAPVDRRQIERDLAWLSGRGDFERLDYRIVTERDRNVLLVQVQEKPWGPNYFRFGLGLGTDFRGQGEFSFVANHTRRWVNSLGAEWRNELQIGRSQRLSTEFYQPILPSESLFVTVGAEQQRRVADVSPTFASFTDYPIAQYGGVNSRFGADLGVAFGRYGEFRIGPLYERVTLSPRIGQPSLSQVRANESGMHASVVIDQRDSATFARRGYRIEASAHRALTAFGASTNFSRYQWSSEYAKTFGANTIDVAVKFGGLYSNATGVYPYFELGGFLQLSGLRANELRADQVAFARLVGFRQIGTLPAFGRGIYVGGSLEAGSLDSPNSTVAASRRLYGSSIFLGLDTAIGPFYVGYGQATGGRKSAYLLLGRP